MKSLDSPKSSYWPRGTIQRTVIETQGEDAKSLARVPNLAASPKREEGRVTERKQETGWAHTSQPSCVQSLR